MTGHIHRLEQIGHATWPSLEDGWLNGWLLRAGGGVTRRSNSANPHDNHDVDLGAQVDLVEAWFGERGLSSIVRLTPAADPEIDRHLKERGYAHDHGAIIMTNTLAAIDHAQALDVPPSARPSPQWLDVAAREPGRGGPQRAVLEQLLDRIGLPAGYAGIGRGDLHAIGLGVVVDTYVAIFMMRTEPHVRRRGLASQMAAGLMAWGAKEGAVEAFLQVHPANTPAIALYESLGFESQYEYWYRQKE